MRCSCDLLEPGYFWGREEGEREGDCLLITSNHSESFPRARLHFAKSLSSPGKKSAFVPVWGLLSNLRDGFLVPKPLHSGGLAPTVPIPCERGRRSCPHDINSALRSVLSFDIFVPFLSGKSSGEQPWLSLVINVRVPLASAPYPSHGCRCSQGRESCFHPQELTSSK